MIKKLRIKFAILSMIALFVLLLVIVTSMNVLNYHTVVAEADDMLSIQTNTGKIKAVNVQQAIAYAREVSSAGKNSGFVESYRFACQSEGTSIRITFLDCGQKLNAFRTFLFFSIGMSSLGYVLFFFVILFFSGKIILPAAESYEKQKQLWTPTRAKFRQGLQTDIPCRLL